jgi:hypothetical protein
MTMEPIVPPPSDVVLRVRRGSAGSNTLRFRGGEEVKPLSIGQKGWWSVSAEGVEDQHVYVHFDGKKLRAMAVHPQNPPLLDGFPLARKWTEVPSPSVIALGAARILVDRVDAQAPSELVPGELFVHGADDEIPVTFEESPGRSTMVLGSNMIEQVLASKIPSRPRSTVRIDVEQLWSHVQRDEQSLAADEPAPAPSRDAWHTRPLEVRAPALEEDPEPEEALTVEGVPRGFGAWFRQAPLRRRALVVMLPLGVLLVLTQWATAHGVRLQSGSRAAPPAPRAAPSVAAAPAPVAPLPDPAWPAVAATPAQAPPFEASHPVLAEPTSSAPSAPRGSPPDPASARRGAQPRTLERDAVDAVARADFAAASKVYAHLAELYPERSVFRESARILSEKVTGPAGR